MFAKNATNSATTTGLGSVDVGPSAAAAYFGPVRYAHAAIGVPILITEHGLNTNDDRLRAEFIPAALTELNKVIADGIPVLGYIHWSLLDNFEWVFGFGHHLGLVSVDRQTFRRTPKPSAYVLGSIARGRVA